MKAILEFNLPDDVYEYKAAYNGADMKVYINEFYDILRDISKYDSPHFEDKDIMFEYIKAQFLEQLGDYLND